MEKLEELFVSYEIAKQLEQKGFGDVCFGYYNSEMILTLDSLSGSGEQQEDLYSIACLAPLYQQVVDWLESKHKLFIAPYYLKMYKYCFQIIDVSNLEDIDSGIRSTESLFSSNKESLNKAIQQALKLI